MPAPMPPQGGAQGGPPPGPSGQPPQGGQGGGAAQAVQMVSQGLMQLKQIIDGSGDALAPEEKQEFMGLMNGWQAFVQELQKPPGQEQAPPQQGRPGVAQPMPANAGKGSAPANY